jgi:hypothetical protein
LAAEFHVVGILTPTRRTLHVSPSAFLELLFFDLSFPCPPPRFLIHFTYFIDRRPVTTCKHDLHSRAAFVDGISLFSQRYSASEHLVFLTSIFPNNQPTRKTTIASRFFQLALVNQTALSIIGSCKENSFFPARKTVSPPVFLVRRVFPTLQYLLWLQNYGNFWGLDFLWNHISRTDEVHGDLVRNDTYTPLATVKPTATPV